MKIIPRQVHALLDYSWSAAIAVAPKVLAFEDEHNARRFLRAMGSATAVGSLLTRYELGALKVMPFKMHLATDALGAMLGLASPWLFGFSRHKTARNTALAFFAIEALVVLLSQTDEMDHSA
ncbi:MAG TPA: hypothetical protein VF600_00255 [Abditibacteriaceae bacterium]